MKSSFVRDNTLPSSNIHRANLDLVKKAFKPFVFSLALVNAINFSADYKRKDNEARAYTTSVNMYIHNFEDDDYEVGGHRGYSDRALDNSYEAIKLCIDAKHVDFIEVDLMKTGPSKDFKDKKEQNSSFNCNNVNIDDGSEFVINHDEKIQDYVVADNDRETLDKINDSIEYKINPITYWKSFFNPKDGFRIREMERNLQGKKARLLSLEEVTDLCQDKQLLIDCKVNIDRNKYAEDLKNEIIEKNISLENIVFSSEDIDFLKELRRKFFNNKDFKCMPLIRSKQQLEELESQFDHFSIRKNVINDNPEVIKDLIDSDNKVFAWTFKTKKEVEKTAHALGPDYHGKVSYICDSPDITSYELNEYKNECIRESIKNNALFYQVVIPPVEEDATPCIIDFPVNENIKKLEKKKKGS